MLIRRTAALALAALALGACKGDSGAGPEDLQYDLGIISGNHQVARAGSPQLSEPVVGKLVSVRLADGSTRLQFVRPLYAQTSVRGSPVPGAVVCAAKLTDGAPEPFTPCTNTKNDGTAVFFFAPGTKAGEHLNEIRGTVNDQPAAFDTVHTTVMPGNVYRVNGKEPSDTVAVGDTLWLPNYIAGATDAFGNPIDPADITNNGPPPQWGWRRSGYQYANEARPQGEGWVVVVPEVAATWPGLYCPPPGMEGPCTGSNAVVNLWFQGSDLPNGISFVVLPKE